MITVPTDYSTIQAAIDAAANGDEIVVLPWTYRENINFGGKNIVVKSTDPTSPSVVAGTIIVKAAYGAVITFSGSESAASVLSGFTITGGEAAGGVWGNGTRATIHRNVITGNMSHNGGGVNYCHGVVEFNTITSNTGVAAGGLYDCDGIIRNNAITHNIAYPGTGGLAACDGIIISNVVAYNTAHDTRDRIHYYSGHGGGLANCHGMILNNTIYGNTATGLYSAGGGLAGCGGFIANCIIWGNSAEFDPDEYQISGDVAPFYSCIQDWPTTSAGNIASDPRLVAPANGDFHLQSDSPCIGRGNLFYLAGDFFADIDGECRLAGQSVDIGCDEFGSARDSDGDLLPDSEEVRIGANPTLADTDGDGLNDGVEVLRGTNPIVLAMLSGFEVPLSCSSIQEAIFLAFPGESITVSSGTYFENLSFLGKDLVLRSTNPDDPDIVNSTIVNGGFFAPVIFLKGTGPSCAIRGLTIRNGLGYLGGCIQGAGSLATIEGNQIMAGRADNGGGLCDCDGAVQGNFITGNSAEYGGGLYDCGGTIRGNTIMGNSASSDGGGLYECAGTVESNTVTSNSASDEGGGLYGCDGTIRNNMITSNSAAFGGGLYGCDGLVSSNAISSNTALSQGGGLHNCNGAISDNTISQNKASAHGGGIYWCSATIENNLITGNCAVVHGGGGAGTVLGHDPPQHDFLQHDSRPGRRLARLRWGNLRQ